MLTGNNSKLRLIGPSFFYYSNIHRAEVLITSAVHVLSKLAESFVGRALKNKSAQTIGQFHRRGSHQVPALCGCGHTQTACEAACRKELRLEQTLETYQSRPLLQTSLPTLRTLFFCTLDVDLVVAGVRFSDSSPVEKVFSGGVALALVSQQKVAHFLGFRAGGGLFCRVGRVLGSLHARRPRRWLRALRAPYRGSVRGYVQ